MTITKRNAVHAALCVAFVCVVMLNEPSWFTRAFNWLEDHNWGVPSWLWNTGPQGVNPPPPPAPPPPPPPPVDNGCCG